MLVENMEMSRAVREVRDVEWYCSVHVTQALCIQCGGCVKCGDGSSDCSVCSWGCLMSVKVDVSSVGTDEQKVLLVQYARAGYALSLDSQDQEARVLLDEAQRRLIAMGLYPCYDDNDGDGFYLCIPG